VAVIEINRSALPETTVYRTFTPQHLHDADDPIEVGTSLLVVGFPLGFHDTLHHMSVVRHAVIASSFGLRFQGEGYFLTDARTHRGTSGAPVVMRASEQETVQGDLPWVLLGVHSARLDIGTRDLKLDEALGPPCRNATFRHGTASIFMDKISGAKTERLGLTRCLDTLQRGDILVVWRLDRLGRSMRHLITLVEDLRTKGIGFRSINEGAIDTTNATTSNVGFRGRTGGIGGGGRYGLCFERADLQHLFGLGPV